MRHVRPGRLKHDPEKLQTFRIRSCGKDKSLERNRISMRTDFALAATAAILAFGALALSSGRAADDAERNGALLDRLVAAYPDFLASHDVQRLYSFVLNVDVVATMTREKHMQLVVGKPKIVFQHID